jgi:hypothetical protein
VRPLDAAAVGILPGLPGLRPGDVYAAGSGAALLVRPSSRSSATLRIS